MEFSRQEYWSGLPFPSPEDLPDPGIEPGFPALEANCLSSELPGKPQFITGFQEICFQVPVVFQDHGQHTVLLSSPYLLHGT